MKNRNKDNVVFTIMQEILKIFVVVLLICLIQTGKLWRITICKKLKTNYLYRVIILLCTLHA